MTIVNQDKRVDEYITESEVFAQPILKHLRKLVHQACPEVTETIKWGMPYFEYQGILCGMASFKNHTAFVFRKQKLIKGLEKYQMGKESAMGSFGKITSLKDLPSNEILLNFIKEAVRLNVEKIEAPKITLTASNKKWEIPEDFLKELKKNKAAYQTFQNFSPSNKKEYVEWVITAKSAETRNAHIKTSIEWISQGKVKNWKYIRKNRSS